MKKEKKNLLCVFGIETAIDLITNSSSELFIFDSKKEILVDLIKYCHDTYLRTSDVKSLRELDGWELQTVLEHYGDISTYADLYFKFGVDIKDKYDHNSYLCYGLDNLEEEDFEKIYQALDPEGKILVIDFCNENGFSVGYIDRKLKDMCIFYEYH